MSSNKLIISAAGSGKTSHLVKSALSINEHMVLVTTFTEENKREIEKKITLANKYIPKNIVVQTWYSFLLQHGIRPYQKTIFDFDIRGVNMQGGQSAKYTKETDLMKHYFDSENRIYSDKISKLAFKINNKNEDKIIKRLTQIFPSIFIDEVQDLSGYDLELLQLLFNANSNILLVCDPRQSTFTTSNSPKYKQYRFSSIIEFFKTLCKNVEIDEGALLINHRCNQTICDLSNKLYPEYKATTSGQHKTSGHDGVFLVKPNMVEKYIDQYHPIQLRDSIKTKVSPNSPALNIGASKGLSFDRVLIYPTTPIINWLKDHNAALKPKSRSKLYVAITRSRYSVAFVYDYTSNGVIRGMSKY